MTEGIRSAVRITMRSSSRGILVALSGLCLSAQPAVAQRHYPPISARQFTSGSADIKVTGAFTMDTKIALNTVASIGDGEMTWLQFGASGAAAPNATITFNDLGEVGVIVAQGTVQATGGIGGNEKPWCTGKVEAKPNLLSGGYTCAGITSYDRKTGRMDKVTIEVRFTAGS
jgi:hypothetical protein